jgi:hypothetical protein
MKFSIILLGAALCLFSSTEAGISTGTPYNAVTWNGGDVVKITWSDDEQPPLLESIGITTVDLMVGGNSSQVKVANIGTTQAFAKEIGYTVPKDVGPPGTFYFIKYTANTYTSFSGTFTIANVNGVIPGFDPKNPNPVPTPATPPATPSTQSTPSAPKADNPKAASASPAAADSPLPTPLSANNAAANLLPLPV